MSALRKFIAAIEPWYDWGRIDTQALTSITGEFADEVNGEVRWFTLHTPTPARED